MIPCAAEIQCAFPEFSGKESQSNLPEWNVVRDVKDSRRASIGDKRKDKENVGPLLKEMGDLITEDMEKTEVLNSFLCLSLY